ncbi:unnamed protein product [Rotaria magnacalcarata]|uniref:Alkaline phosphatase n=1 Tax=Rotaria magnacalcarata TaxID=392030 RepID=A0A816QUG1_9BILA|nr:unnamed protein product [Rotaria magnacalcarata]CAF4007886.1 unnamed protein product [Rotaria magnacalcarata]
MGGLQMERRHFLKASFFTVAAAGLPFAALHTHSAMAASTVPKGTYHFPQGVASGDPRAHSLVFWARCQPLNTSAVGANDPIALTLEVSTSPTFKTITARVALQATATYDFTTRAKVTKLKAYTNYYYRFIAGNDISAVGTSRTAPRAGIGEPDTLKFAWISCQDWSVNHWQAMSLLAEEELDFLVHLGDYIYETVGAAFQTGAAAPAHTPLVLPSGTSGADNTKYANTLEDYRYLYRQYRSDPRLQTLHQKFPLLAIWDDHEFSDDCWKDHQTYTNANVQQTSRRRSANQAWIENMPIDFGDVSFDLNNANYDNIRIYRDFQFGSLFDLILTDERLYRDDHAVNEATWASQLGHDPVNGSDSSARYFVAKPVLQQFEATATAALGRAPSILGDTQTQWWKNKMKSSTAAWRIWGNEVMLNRLQVDLTKLASAPNNQVFIANADAWDGYPSYKAELMGYLKNENIKNVVAITGDLHAFQVGVVRDVPDTKTGTPVLVDFLGAGISSSSFYSYVKAGAAGTPLSVLLSTPQIFDGLLKINNPDLLYADHDAQGFATATITKKQLEVTFHKVKPLRANGTAPIYPLLKKTRFTLAAGSNKPIMHLL